MALTKTRNGTTATDPDKLLEFAVELYDTVAVCTKREADPYEREMLERRGEEIKEIITVLDGECFPGR